MRGYERLQGIASSAWWRHHSDRHAPGPGSTRP
jgi:hypothetical protein